MDASKEKDFELSKIKEEDLPENMKKMTPEERKAHLDKMTLEREALQKEMKELEVARARYIDDEMKKQNIDQDSAFDKAVRQTLREQAEKKGFTFENK